MTGEQAIAFVGFALTAAATPGPSNVLLTATGAQVGVLRGLPCLVGVAVGMATMMFVVTLGLGGVVLGHPLVLKGLRWGGAVMLCWLGWRIATAGRADPAAADRPVGFVGAAIFQLVNPKSWLVCAGAAATFLDGESGDAPRQAAALAGLLFLRSSRVACPGSPSGPFCSASCGPNAPPDSSTWRWACCSQYP